MKKFAEAGYNERLFSGGIRTWFHLARFDWTAGAMRRHAVPCRDILEFGCFDGRLLSHLPRASTSYLGLDADWEGGLATAQITFDDPRMSFVKSRSPQDVLDAADGRVFDTIVTLETLEHVPPESVADYLSAFSLFCSGFLIVTVPNEKGIVFLLKHLFQRMSGCHYDYTLREAFFATIGRLDRVRRNEHKGFDYERIVSAVSRHFDLVEVTPYPWRWLPRSLGFGIGIVARSRATGSATARASELQPS